MYVIFYYFFVHDDRPVYKAGMGLSSELVLCLIVILSSYYIPTQGHDYHAGEG